MKKVWNALCVAVFVVGLVTFAQTPGDDAEPARSFTVVMAHFRINADGSKTNLRDRIVYAKANGEQRQTLYDPNDGRGSTRQSTVVARTEEGLFVTAPGLTERKLLSTTAVPQRMQECFRSARCLSANPRFVRTEELAGLQVYVYRDNVPPPNGMEWIEQSYSPKTGFLALHRVSHFRDGSEDVLKATSVEFKDVPDDLNDDIKTMPIRKP
ncbi:MAG: hypothetical protein AABN33_28260 [Acidobacteriota bacterium]